MPTHTPTFPTAKPDATGDFSVASPAHGDVRQTQTPTAPQHPPFSPLDMHPQPSHLASPQKPHLAPPPYPASPALKHTRPDSPPPASRQPQDAMRTVAASAESLEIHDATERETKSQKLEKPENWGSMSASAKTHWKQRRAKHKPGNTRF